MDYTHIPEALLYKKKSVDKLAMLHPLNALVLKRLMKMNGWNKKYLRESQFLPCMNNAYYICTIMRLEFDATFREESYKRIAREKHFEGSNTFIECVTLSLVVILIEHSTPEWRQKLQEVSDDLLQYVYSLFDGETKTWSVIDSEIINEDLLKGIPSYLSKDLDDSWVLPDELFKPRALDEKALYDLHRQDLSFNWDKYYYHHDEDDLREMAEKLGQTQQEKATLIHSFWKDIYYSRKKFDGPIKDTWIFLKTLAQDLCPEYMEMTELHKIPETGIEFEKRISELEAEVTRLEQKLSNVNSEESSELETQVEEQQTTRIKELEAEVEGLKEENAKLKEQLAPFMEFASENGEDNLTGDEKFTLRERIVFFATVLSLELDKKYTVFSNFATFISELCNDQKNISPFISKMKKPEEAAANAKAAKKVAGLLKKILPQQYKNDEHRTINKIINSMMLNFSDDEDE